jgi:hypothetical protein
MKYQLIINDAERDYLLSTMQTALVREANKIPDLDPRRDADKYAKARDALHVAAGLLAALAPSRIEVASDADPLAEVQRAAADPKCVSVQIHDELAARVAAEIGTEFDPRALDPKCVHGVRFADPCPHCSPSD